MTVQLNDLVVLLASLSESGLRLGPGSLDAIVKETRAYSELDCQRFDALSLER